MAELVALDRPLVIAHAGGDQDYPHSTLYAYTQSALAGSDILELDVMLTADGVLIVQHDDTVDRTTEATGPVAELTLAEIQALDNAHWFVPGLWGDQTRPAAEYVLRGVRTGAVEPPPGFGRRRLPGGDLLGRWPSASPTTSSMSRSSSSATPTARRTPRPASPQPRCWRPRSQNWAGRSP